MPGVPSANSVLVPVDDRNSYMGVGECQDGRRWAPYLLVSDDLLLPAVFAQQAAHGCWHYSPTYPAPTQQILRTGLARAVESSSADDRDRLLFLDLAARPLTASSSTPSTKRAGRKTGLKDKLPSGVVGAVEASSMTASSESTVEMGMGFILYQRKAAQMSRAGWSGCGRDGCRRRLRSAPLSRLPRRYEGQAVERVCIERWANLGFSRDAGGLRNQIPASYVGPHVDIRTFNLGTGHKSDTAAVLKPGRQGKAVFVRTGRTPTTRPSFRGGARLGRWSREGFEES